MWINPPYSFDNVFSAIKALFICSTTEGWIDIMHSGQDVTTIYQPPVRDAEWGNFTFFWARPEQNPRHALCGVHS